MTWVLQVMEYNPKEMHKCVKTIGSMGRLLTLKRDSIERKSDIGIAIIDELMCLKSWYLKFLKSDASKRMSIEKAFTRKVWKKFVLDSVDDEYAMKNKLQKGNDQQTSKFKKTCKKGKGFNWMKHITSITRRRGLELRRRSLGLRRERILVQF